MHIQLLMIIAVIASSLLTISQRANAQEVSQFRWLEPTIEQRCSTIVVPDQDNGSDNKYVAFVPVRLNLFVLTPSSIFNYRFPVITKVSGSTNPRAPPLSLI